MIGFRVIFIFALSLSVFLLMIVLIITSMSVIFKEIDNNLRQKNLNEAVTSFVYKISGFKFLSLVIILTIEICIFICINSLYLEIKEQSNQQRQSIKFDYIRKQSLPTYSQAIQPQIVVPRHPEYQVQYKFSQYAV